MDPFDKPLSIILIPSKIIEDFPIFNITCNEIMTWFLDKREWTEVDQSVSIHSQLWSNIRICREVSCHHELTEHLQKLTDNIRKVFTGLVIESRALRSWDDCCFLSIDSKSLNFFNYKCITKHMPWNKLWFKANAFHLNLHRKFLLKPR